LTIFGSADTRIDQNSSNWQ